jgi:hypothetical protein
MQAEKIIEGLNVVRHTSGMSNSVEEKPVSVRLPAQVKDALAQVAQKERRSMNQTFIL